MSRPTSVDDPRFDQTPGVGAHQPILLDLLGSADCVLGVCEHQGPPHCPTAAKKVCAACTAEEVSPGDDLQALTSGAMRWPCPVTRGGGYSPAAAPREESA